MEQPDYHKYHALIKENCVLVKDFGAGFINEKPTINNLCIVKNGAFYIKNFIEYHKKVGVEAFIFLDNGSSDDTVKIASRYDFVKVISNTLPYKTYWHHFKRFLFEEYGRGCWNLILDIDEFFEGPFNNDISLKELVNYNEKNKYTAVVTHMVDLLPNENILSKNRNINFLESHLYYSTQNLDVKPYKSIIKSNKVYNSDINFYTNGWRDAAFGVGEIMLTKHSFIKGDKKLMYTHDHFVDNSTVADYSCILKHYKFHDNFSQYVTDSVLEGNHYNNSKEYVLYQKKLNENKELNLYNEKMFNVNDKNKLIENKLIQISSSLLLYCYEKRNERFPVFLKESIESNKNYNKLLVEKNYELKQEINELKNSISLIKDSWTWKIARFMTKWGGKILKKE